MNSENGSWQVTVKKPAEKNLLRALEEMELDPFAGDVLPLKAQPTAFRRRVGNWRLFFDVDTARRLVEVRFIERRTTTTYKKRS